MGGKVLDGSERVGNVEAETDVVVGSLSGGSDESCCQLGLAVGPTPKCLGPMAGPLAVRWGAFQVGLPVGLSG